MASLIFHAVKLHLKNSAHTFRLSFLACTTQLQHDAIYLQDSERKHLQDQIYTFFNN